MSDSDYIYDPPVFYWWLRDIAQQSLVDPEDVTFIPTSNLERKYGRRAERTT